MATDDRWKKLAHIMEAQDVAVDLEAVADNPEWADQAQKKHGSRAREFVAAFDALLAEFRTSDGSLRHQSDVARGTRLVSDA